MPPSWLTYGMSTNLPRQGPKWKLANRLELHNDEVGIIKQSRSECKEDQN